MYRAKAAGGARYARLRRARCTTRAVERLKLESDLRRAVERGELGSTTSRSSRSTTGESSASRRWSAGSTRRRGLISPGEFIPVAEETGLIVPIGALGAARGVPPGADWQRMPHPPASLSMSVNLSRTPARRPPTSSSVIAASLARHRRRRPSRLKLEITESALMERRRVGAWPLLGQLKALGVELAIDDFGTGYSSLGYLAPLPARRR